MPIYKFVKEKQKMSKIEYKIFGPQFELKLGSPPYDQLEKNNYREFTSKYKNLSFLNT